MNYIKLFIYVFAIFLRWNTMELFLLDFGWILELHCHHVVTHLKMYFPSKQNTKVLFLHYRVQNACACVITHTLVYTHIHTHTGAWKFKSSALHLEKWEKECLSKNDLSTADNLLYQVAHQLFPNILYYIVHTMAFTLIPQFQ